MGGIYWGVGGMLVGGNFLGGAGAFGGGGGGAFDGNLTGWGGGGRWSPSPSFKFAPTKPRSL